MAESGTSSPASVPAPPSSDREPARYAIRVRGTHPSGFRRRDGVQFYADRDVVLPAAEVTAAMHADEWLDIRDARKPARGAKPAAAEKATPAEVMA